MATVRKNFRLEPESLKRAQQILGTSTETETVQKALDLVAYREEVLRGIRSLAGANDILDVFGELEGGEGECEDT